MHALVTGGGGFLGGYIIEALLARGHRVRSFGRGDYPQLRAQSVEVVQGDIRDPDAVARACDGIFCVFHAAALAGIGVNGSDFYRTNVQGTENVIAACRKGAARQLVYTSSPSVVFAGQDQCGVNESTQPNLNWLRKHWAHYSVSKALAEQAVLHAN